MSRDDLLARLRSARAAGVPANHAHPAPEPRADAPVVGFAVLDGQSRRDTFIAQARRVDAEVHEVDDAGIGPLLAALAQRYGIATAVCTAEDVVAPFAAAATDCGISVSPYSRSAASRADLGVTGSSAAVAATGSVVVDVADSGARGASLLPRVHLCVVRDSDLVDTPADVLFRWHAGDDLSANVVFITGPSRTGDIEQILTLGVHGPLALHIALIDDGPAPERDA